MQETSPSIPDKFKSKVEFVNLEHTQDGLIYFYVNFLDKVSPKERGPLLLDLEDALCKNENRIRVWHVALGDKNSLRNLRGIKFKD